MERRKRRHTENHVEKELKDEIKKMAECKKKRGKMEKLWDLKWDKSNVGARVVLSRSGFTEQGAPRYQCPL